jgi:hypothetical protein
MRKSYPDVDNRVVHRTLHNGQSASRFLRSKAFNFSSGFVILDTAVRPLQRVNDHLALTKIVDSRERFKKCNTKKYTITSYNLYYVK